MLWGGSEPLFLEVTEERQATASECEGIGGTVKVYNHTYQEVYDAIMAGQNIYMEIVDDFGDTTPYLQLHYPSSICPSTHSIWLVCLGFNYNYTLVADTANDYLKEIICNEM